MTDDTEPIIPPIDAQRVARRALILAAVVCRSFIDDPARADEGEPLRKRICSWISKLNVQDEMESGETALLHAPIGTIDQKTKRNSTGLVEDLSILIWALSLSPLPKMDEQVDPYATTDLLCFLHDDARCIVENATLRGAAELNACREVFYAYHCRLNDFRRNKVSKNVSSWFEPEWLSLLKLENVLGPDGDLLLKQNSLAKAEESVRSACTSIAASRHRAIIWLVEEQGVYSCTPVDT